MHGGTIKLVHKTQVLKRKLWIVHSIKGDSTLLIASLLKLRTLQQRNLIDLLISLEGISIVPF